MVSVFQLTESGFQVGLPQPPVCGDYLTLEVLLGPQRFARGWVGRVIALRPGADGLWYTDCEIMRQR